MNGGAFRQKRTGLCWGLNGPDCQSAQITPGLWLRLDENRGHVWGLPVDYPMVAPNYSKRRSQFAKQIGLGRGGKAAKKKQSGRLRP
ncbi:MucR family transcriptional regulator [Hyphobacterium sp. WM6]